MTVILNTPHEITDIPKAKKLKVVKGEIELKDVDFFYHQTRKVLKSFNLKIASKERLALIGPSGAGKTTVVKEIVSRIKDTVKTIDMRYTMADQMKALDEGTELKAPEAKDFNLSICFCAFTGRAVQQMKNTANQI